jgi:Cys-rich repeat protein
MRFVRNAALLLVAIFGLLTSCTPQPKNPACMTDAECTLRSEGYTYCVESHCVKCLSDAMCKNGTSCIDGICSGR